MSLSGFLFGAMLLALPLSLLPIILHLLFRRKSPVVPFPTLRFIKSSLQQTAARRKVQRWILLAVRVLLLALLIWAIAQPVSTVASSWAGTGKSASAAIVVDTSYSMMLEDHGSKLLTRADDITQDLLRGVLKDSRVAIFTSRRVGKSSPAFKTPTELLSQWRPLQPEPASSTLATRVTEAVEALSKDPSEHKWLVIISDLQNREFPGDLAELKPGQTGSARTVLFDLHPGEPRNAGITDLRVEPDQPIPGVASSIHAQVMAGAGDSRSVMVKVTNLTGTPLLPDATLQASFAKTGKTEVLHNLRSGMPAVGPDKKPLRWLIAQASLQAEGPSAMEWDNLRQQVLAVPPVQSVTFLASPRHRMAQRFIRLALDPWEGAGVAWPLSVRTGTDLTGAEQVVVATLSEWPDDAMLGRLTAFARSGGTLILFLQPGLEQSWNKLGEPQRRALLALLPSQPITQQPPSGTFRAAPAIASDPVLDGLGEAMQQIDQMVLDRYVPLAKPESAGTTPLLNMLSTSHSGTGRTLPLLVRRTLGSGAVYTVASVPDPIYGTVTLASHPLFMPMMVRICLQSAGRSDAQNVELGQELSLSLGTRGIASPAGIQLVDPKGAVYQFDPGKYREGEPFIWSAAEKRLSYPHTLTAGLYYWRKAGSDVPLAIGNVQYPSAESDLVYREASKLVTPGPDVIIARRTQLPDGRAITEMDSFLSQMEKVSEPEPRWTKWLVLVLLLICVEALLGSMSQLWKPISLGSLLPKMAKVE